MIVPRYFEDLSVLHENTLPVRSYYVPTSGESDLPGVRTSQDAERVQLAVPVLQKHS